MEQPTQRDNEVLHYVANEVCVVLRVPPTVRVDAASRAVYDEVMRHLNEQIETAIDGLRDKCRYLARGTLGEDLGLTLLNGPRIRTDLQLSSLERGPAPRAEPSGGYGVAAGDQYADRETTRPTISPYVHFPTGQGSSDLLHFYHVGPPGRLGFQEMLDRAPLIRALVNLINGALRGQPIRTSVGTLTISAATPNWLSGGSQGTHLSGGPGTSPDTGPAGTRDTGRFSPVNPSDADLGPLLDGSSGGQGIVVAVLDTCPAAGAVQSAATAHPDNWLLQDVANSPLVSIDGPLSVTDDQFDHLAQIYPNWYGDLSNLATAPDDHYFMTDHGLFVTGIIRSIAPAAEIHLVRVLNRFGVGDLVLLTNIVSQLGSLLDGRPANTRLVINLSLMLDIPTSLEMLQLWFPATSEDPEQLRYYFNNIAQVIDAIQTSITSMIAATEEQGFLLVAAAGNDGRGQEDTAHPDPRWPAQSPSVLGVAAVTRAQQAATFSNAADMMTLSNGVAVFGGNAVLGSEATGRPRIAPDADENPDAVVGIFSSPTLPFGVGNNTTGWVYWAGTSFSTPIVAGLAANYWSRNPALTPADVISHFRTIQGTAPEDLLRCQAIQVHQQT